MISHRVQKRLTHEVHEALALRDKRGQSKHKDKQAARKAAQDNHTAYKTITGLYATTSLTTYARQAKDDCTLVQGKRARTVRARMLYLLP